LFIFVVAIGVFAISHRERSDSGISTVILAGSLMKAEVKCPRSMRPHIESIWRGEYDVPYKNLRPTILDVGANVGGFAVWAATRWPNCKIFCYEPLPDNFGLLKTNVELLRNTGITNQIEIHNFAIGNPSRTKMFLGRNNPGEASFFDLGEQQKKTIEVTTQSPTIMPRAHILKLDAEGTEIEILSALDSIDYDIVILEYHSENHRRQADVILRNYALIGGHARTLNRGVLKYAHSRLIKGWEKNMSDRNKTDRRPP
jgi:FkbM family methyltransferase